MDKLSKKNLRLVSLMLFSLFFGAGNLIFQFTETANMDLMKLLTLWVKYIKYINEVLHHPYLNLLSHMLCLKHLYKPDI